MFLIVVLGLSRNTSGKGVSVVLWVSRVPSAELHVHCLVLCQQPRVLFILKFLSTVPLLLTVCKDDCGGVVKPHF